MIQNLRFTLPPDLETEVAKAKQNWESAGSTKRLWEKDATLWTNSDESKWLGWLDIVPEQLSQVEKFKQLSAEVQRDGFETVLLMGMGGSSLCPEVFSITFGKQAGFPELLVLDSTDPAQIRSFREKIDPRKTLFFVSSKSGTTLEPNIYMQYFFEETKKLLGDQAGKHFIAITDPGSKLEAVAKQLGFRRVYYGVASIGGRYSALSDFGLVPHAAMGLDTARLLQQANQAVEQSKKPVDENPGVQLGLLLGTLARKGRDKLTIVCSPSLYDLGAWLEQLIAESTGKEGKGIIPVDRESIADPGHYGSDRVFAYLKYAGDQDADQEGKLAALEKAGHPIVRIDLPDLYDIGQAFFLWEIATAVAGAVIGINAFNQPDVEASKIVTRELTSAYEKNGSLPTEEPISQGDGIKLYTDPKNAEALQKNAASVAELIHAHLNRVGAGDYFALLAYIDMNEENEKKLQRIRHAVRDIKKVATCLGFGPRFLHSTGQAYKGGPNSGVFLQITCDEANDLPVPQQKYPFGVVKAAQARGDFQVLADRGRRALRVHLGPDVSKDLDQLYSLVSAAISGK